MGLDIYVGRLTRYYTGEWETILQQSSSPAPGSPGTTAPPISTKEAADLQATRAELKVTLEKIAADLGADLVLWAAHEEHPNVPRPRAPVTDWTTDEAWQLSAAKTFESRYGELVHGAELWLPGDFSFTFEAEDMRGKKVIIGSNHELARQLRLLNERSWRAEEGSIDRWRREGADPGAPLEKSAQFALAVFLFLCEKSVTHRLPMKLDY